jgi:hypothetical protein
MGVALTHEKDCPGDRIDVYDVMGSDRSWYAGSGDVVTVTRCLDCGASHPASPIPASHRGQPLDMLDPVVAEALGVREA